MNDLCLRRAGLSLMTGLATCLLATSLSAQSPAAGVVRITDQAQRVPAHSLRGRPAEAARVHQVSAERGYLAKPAPQVVTRHAHAMTGNPVVDLIRTASARSTTKTHVVSESGCSSCDSGSCGSSYCSSCGDDDSNFGRLLRDGSEVERSFLRRLFGYFIPDGCCGQGCPPFGVYHLNYAANPRYFDRRDGGVYAAQGYNVPMAVPLAPTVRQTYNYSWGIPSSRLTPISTRAPF